MLLMNSVLSATCLANTGGDQHIVLPPLKNDSKLATKMLVFIPGGNVPNAHYVNTSKAIQAATNLNLWVTIPSVTNRLCIIECTAKMNT